MLNLKKVSLYYGKQQVVSNVSLNINQGERLVIVGASGCGKTTLLKSIAGYHPIKTGQITFNGQLVKDPTQQLVPGHENIKLVNQDFALDIYHTVEENIRLKLLQYDKAYLTKRVNELLALTELDSFRNQKAIELSGGQKQRLAIARALADEPDLLLLDEPFNQLDYHLKRKIEQYILNYIQKYNIALILVTHNGEEAMRWSNKVAFMKKGKILRQDTATNFYNYPTNKYEANFFGKMNTIIYQNKELSFRPHQFSETGEKDYVKLDVEFHQQINNGWFTDFKFKYGQRLFSLFSQKNIKGLNTVWVKPIKYNVKP
jgi:ABC-type Fe3+/spermidine/putrescine transport system ATPase subunit